MANLHEKMKALPNFGPRVGLMLDLEKIKERAEASTSGPRHSMYGGEPNLVGGQRGEKVDLLAEFHGPSHDGRCPDADFFAHAREDVLALVTEVERLRAAIKQGAKWAV